MARDFGDADALVHRHLAQHPERLLLAVAALLHQDPLRALDDLALGERRLRARQLVPQRLELLEARDRHLEHGPDPLRARAFHHVSRHARAHRRADALAVALVDEHHDRARLLARDALHVLERVAVGRVHVDDHEVGLDRAERRVQVDRRDQLSHDLAPGVLQCAREVARAIDARVEEQHAQLVLHAPRALRKSCAGVRGCVRGLAQLCSATLNCVSRCRAAPARRTRRAQESAAACLCTRQFARAESSRASSLGTSLATAGVRGLQRWSHWDNGVLRGALFLPGFRD